MDAALQQAQPAQPAFTARPEADLRRHVALLDDCIQSVVDLRTKATLIFEDVVYAADGGVAPADVYYADLRQIHAGNQQLRNYAAQLDEYGVVMPVTEYLQNEVKAAVDPAAMEQLRHVKRQRTQAAAVAKMAARQLETLARPIAHGLAGELSAAAELVVDETDIAETVRVASRRQPDVTVRQLLQPSGTGLVALVVEVNNVLRGLLGVRTMAARGCWVLDDLVVFAPSEKTKLPHDASEHHVFQQLSVIAGEHFQSLKASAGASTGTRDVLLRLLAWLASYRDLFSAPCDACKQLLRFDSQRLKFLPPVHRVWQAGSDRFVPLHSHCRA